MMFSYTLVSLLSVAGIALAQGTQSVCDGGICLQSFSAPNGLSVGSAFPRDSGRDEFIGELSAPSSVKWAGWALGGSMAGDILVVVWPNGNDFTFSTRMASGYSLPGIYNGPSITKLPGSTVNGDGSWKFVFRCQGCTKWTGSDGTAGSIGDSQPQGWATSTKAPNNLGDAGSSFSQHDDFGIFGMDVASARTDSYDSYLSGGSGGDGSSSANGGTSSGATGSTSADGSTGPTSTGAGVTGSVTRTGTGSVTRSGTATGTGTATGSAGTSVHNYIGFGSTALLVVVACLLNL